MRDEVVCVMMGMIRWIDRKIEGEEGMSGCRKEDEEMKG